MCILQAGYYHPGFRFEETEAGLVRELTRVPGMESDSVKIWGQVHLAPKPRGTGEDLPLCLLPGFIKRVHVRLTNSVHGAGTAVGFVGLARAEGHSSAHAVSKRRFRGAWVARWSRV